jgi:(2R)-3-sulfolactate dehydrogenase (NADP+)
MTMADAIQLSLTEAQDLAAAALVASGTSPGNARPTARALVAAEADGQAGHGLSRVPSYALHVRAGKVDGLARPTLERVGPAALRVDAAQGFAYPAIEIALDALAPLARQAGLALALIRHSHHFGQAGAHAERMAEQGLICLVLGNTPRAMAFWGGRTPAMGTNPIAFAAPMADGRPPLVIDLALSVAARGKIVAAQKAGKPIPPDWAVGPDGQPTQDASTALAGALSPIGGAKGAALALMVEVLAGALTGSSFGWEASSMFDDKGGPPNTGHLLLALDPGPLSGGAFAGRMLDLVHAIESEPGARLPGSKRLQSRERAARDGVQVAAALHDEIQSLINHPA